MKVRNLSVGPILGATDDKSARLLGRSKLEVMDGNPRRSHGVARIREFGDPNYRKPIFFKMNPNFDMTGVCLFNDLNEDTEYEYQFGWIFSDEESSAINVSARNLDWKSIHTFSFKSASNDENKERTIITGSCRYALRMLGGVWFDDRGDKSFRSVSRLIESGEQIDQLIMCGDQIYADDLNLVSPDSTIDEYFKRYRSVFTTKYLRNLMSQVPTYMTLDDHEIEDNWPSNASGRDWVNKFPAAIHAYSTYQASHSPLFKPGRTKISGTTSHLWYSYQDGCCEFFVTDTRTERRNDENREIIGPNQMKALLKWLSNGDDRVKVVVSSVPFYESESNDKWHGYKEQRDQILETISREKVKKVVFISGDVHACMSSELQLDNGKQKIISVVSSAFFWPYPHPNRRTFKLRGSLDSSVDADIKNASKVFPTDAFSKIVINTDGVSIDFIARKGRVLGSKSYDFS